MPKTFAAAFNQFRSNLELTGLQTATVSTRHQNVRDHIKGHLAVLDSFLTGSYRRHTLIAPPKNADIDIFVVLDPKYFKSDGQAALLDLVRRVLLKKYTKTPRISRNGQAVTIVFTDFRVDVVPGFHRKGGGFLIPDSVGTRWISTDPKRHVEISAVDNKAHGGNLVPALKMFKAWNRVHSERLRSFHLERVFTNSLAGYHIRVWDATIPYALERAAAAVHFLVADPAGYGGDVSSYLRMADRQTVAKALALAKVQARRAQLANAAGRPAAAIGEYRKIFRGYFPAYG